MSSRGPLVSVVIPVYNSEEYLEETIQSVEEQTYAPVEIIVVDNCSDKDSTRAAFDRLHAQYRIVSSAEKGLANARNDGIAAATGEYILPLDSDDLIKPTFIARCVEAFAQAPHVKVVRTNIELFGAKKGEVVFEDYSYPRLLARNVMVATSMFRRSDCLAAGGYDGSLKTCFEDWEFWIRLLKNEGQVATISDALFRYRIRRGSMMRSLNMDALMETRKIIWEKHRDAYAAHFVDPTETFEYRYLRDSKANKIGSLLLKPFSSLKLMK